MDDLLKFLPKMVDIEEGLAVGVVVNDNNPHIAIYDLNTGSHPIYGIYPDSPAVYQEEDNLRIIKILDKTLKVISDKVAHHYRNG